MKETTIIITVVGSLLLFFLPLYLNSKKHSRENKKLKEELVKAGSKENLNLSKLNVWRSLYGLAMDKDKSILVYGNSSQEKVNCSIVELEHYKLCKPAKVLRDVGTGKERHKVVSKINLVLLPMDDKFHPVNFELFNEDHHSNIIMEWELAQEWAKEINNHLIRTKEKYVA
ncbi:hypothetical protein [Echinicola sp. 20G]|uniref:hypothetical protein n=1 Tax=Echinicola sp. 20G TaxID=2781961 RepID=UPI0019111217|nr:hypothetical protein [Echinicola sp. 20G]